MLGKNACAYLAVISGVSPRGLRMYGVDGKLMRGIKSFYDESEACVRVCRRESDWFSVKFGLRQGCVMSPLMFNIFWME